jgi:hypothetical protein
MVAGIPARRDGVIKFFGNQAHAQLQHLAPGPVPEMVFAAKCRPRRLKRDHLDRRPQARAQFQRKRLGEQRDPNFSAAARKKGVAITKSPNPQSSITSSLGWSATRIISAAVAGRGRGRNHGLSCGLVAGLGLDFGPSIPPLSAMLNPIILAKPKIASEYAPNMK